MFKWCVFYFLVFPLFTGCTRILQNNVVFHESESSIYLIEGAHELIEASANTSTIITKIVFEQDSTLSSLESYRTAFENQQLTIFSTHPNGANYAILDLQEQLKYHTKVLSGQTSHTPSLSVRAIKFNLPWSAYRESASMGIHEKTCRDPEFWKSFLDMMLENRFNTLLLYNKHPFPFMVKVPDYPEACPFPDEEMVEWNLFWKALFSMAKERGIDVFIVNWNIIVSPSFAEAHQVAEYNDTSQLTIDYTRKSVTTLINEYPDLAGIGVTLADWMNGMTPAAKEDWIEKTFISGIQDADREVKFLHRAVLSGSADEMRRILDNANLKQPTNVEVKFNWSHGHSTPKLLITHASEAGEVNTAFWDPAPKNYSIQWMIRNEDFFILPWGDPDFIRQHIELNTHHFVNGYHIGSEGYIPALNYFDIKENAPKYAFERQWLFYKLWGRLLYDKNTGNEEFENFINQIFQTSCGSDLLKAFTFASKMPLELGAFFKSTWDYTLYSEGFLAPVIRTQYGIDDKQSLFISLPELMHHQTLDTSYLSIEDAELLRQNGQQPKSWQVSPQDLAQRLMTNADSTIFFLQKIKSQDSNTDVLPSDLVGLEAWAYLSQYFAHKLMAGSLLTAYRNSKNPSDKSVAIKHLEDGISTWEKLSELTKQNYKEVPYWESRVFSGDSTVNNFSWHKYLPQVRRDLEIAQEF